MKMEEYDLQYKLIVKQRTPESTTGALCGGGGLRLPCRWPFRGASLPSASMRSFSFRFRRLPDLPTRAGRMYDMILAMRSSTLPSADPSMDSTA